MLKLPTGTIDAPLLGYRMSEWKPRPNKKVSLSQIFQRMFVAIRLFCFSFLAVIFNFSILEITYVLEMTIITTTIFDKQQIASHDFNFFYC